MDNRLKVIAGAVAIFAAYWAWQYFGTATIAVTSEPEGAIVRVDGRQRAVTPAARIEVDAGSHRLEVSHSHFAPYVEGLNLRRGDHVQRDVTLQPGPGTLTLLSNPRGAWVEVDGVRLPNATPTSLETVSGPHVIRMGRSERHLVEETHVLNAGQTLEVNFNLNMDPHGSLTLSLNPRDARVEFIDAVEPLKYAAKMRLPIGEYALRVSRAGYLTQEFRYTVRYGDNLHNVSLKRAYGRLQVHVQPADAEVTVRYELGGRTQRKAYADPLQVPVGAVQVRARALGHRTGFRNLNLTTDGATVRFDLQRMNVTPGTVLRDTLASGVSGPELVVIPAGRFQMGDPDGPPSERPVRTVTLTQPFAVSRYEVTIGDFTPFAAATGATIHERNDTANPGNAIAYVEFVDAVGYAEWLSKQTGEAYRLPSEAEWEYVARAGTATDYFFGDDPTQICLYGNVADKAARRVYREWDVVACDDGLVRPGPVGTYQPNGFGVYDVYGNVSEWVLECGMPAYANAPSDGSPAEEGLGCDTHGVRGGSWDSQVVEARSAYRNTASGANDDRGIRLIREL